MGIAASVGVWAYLSSFWRDLTPDLVAVEGLSLAYGIDGNRPDDICASVGQCAFTLRNDAANSGGVQGYYSPRHASKRAGWGYSVPVVVAFTHGAVGPTSVTITRSGSTATVSHTSHLLATGNWVSISGATEPEYNGVYQITVVNLNTYTYVVAGTPATPATGAPTSVQCFVKFRGKVAVIDPIPGQYGIQRVRVVAYDGIYDLLEAEARDISYATNKTEAESITLVLDSIPSASQPFARDLDSGIDTFPVVFDKIGSGTKALPLIRDLALSAVGMVFTRGDGTFVFINRHNRTLAASSFTFTNTMRGFVAPSGIDRAFNLIRVTAHPKTISASATDELYTLPTGDATILIAPGDTVSNLFVDYTDPNDRQTKVGGTEVVTVLVGGTHYAANSAANGGGSNLTANISATLTPFASTAKWTLQNTGGTAAYITTLKVIGKAVRDLGPQTAETSSVQDYGEHAFHVDLPYQSSYLLARSYAEFIDSQYSTLAGQIDSMEFIANESTDFLAQALAREPGDAVTVTEAVTGVAAVKATVYSVAFEVRPNCMITCRWGLAPANTLAFWQLGTAGAGELGETTVLGF